MSRLATTPRRGRLFRIAVAVAVLLAVAGYLIAQYVAGGGGAPRCTAGSGGNTYELSPEQAVNAATISAVGTAHGVPEQAVTIALATALQESGLHNLGHGDRDSLGLFQQRPSQGWGTAQQVLDPVYAAGKFYEHLGRVPHYSRLPVTVAAQWVQRSAFPKAYGKHEADAALLASALTGRAPASFTCTAAKSSLAGDPAKVRSQLIRAFGAGILPVAVKSRGQGSELTVPVTATGAAAARSASGQGRASRRGWELAHWAVANSSALHIERVSYAGREWTAGADGNVWRGAADPTSAGPATRGASELRIALVK